MAVEVVTTLHLDGYNLYGKFLKTWCLYFPTDWKITYYAENHNPDLDDRINVVDFNKTCPEWLDFYNHIKLETENLKDKKKLNWYKKALRWSFKMYTVLHALNNSKERYVVWMDSDVYAKKHPTEDWIETVLNGKCFAGQLEHVKGFPHIESGILIFDTHHSDIKIVKRWITEGYIDKKILKEQKAWDGAWLGKLVTTQPIQWSNINMLITSNRALAFSGKALAWLVHVVGDGKFDPSYSGRSGRTKDNELI